MDLKKIAVVLFFIMFIYSGISKICLFEQKVDKLKNKTKLPLIINQMGMIGVILLEIIGSLIILMYTLNIYKFNIKLIKLIYLLYLAFLVVVTLLYHPPTMKIKIPFLSNLTTFGGLLYLFADL